MTHTFSFLAVLAALALSAAANAQTGPEWVRIRAITYAGSGCPAGSVADNVAPDGQAFTLLFDNYIAEAGPGIPLRNSRKNCQLLVDLDFPAGWSFSVFAVDYRGFANLQAGVVGTQRASYYFQGGTGPSAESSLVGPEQRDYHYRDTFAAQTWSPCGTQRALNINSQVRIDNSANPSGSGFMTVDSIDGQVIQTFGITWMTCR